MLMAAVAYNLKKLLNWKTNKVSTIVKAMQIKAERSLLMSVLIIQATIKHRTWQTTKVKA
jgi:hypothetical protein